MWTEAISWKFQLLIGLNKKKFKEEVNKSQISQSTGEALSANSFFEFNALIFLIRRKTVGKTNKRENCICCGTLNAV